MLPSNTNTLFKQYTFASWFAKLQVLLNWNYESKVKHACSLSCSNFFHTQTHTNPAVTIQANVIHDLYKYEEQVDSWSETQLRRWQCLFHQLLWPVVVFFCKFPENLSLYFVFYFGFRPMILSLMINTIWKCSFQFFFHQFFSSTPGNGKYHNFP